VYVVHGLSGGFSGVHDQPVAALVQPRRAQRLADRVREAAHKRSGLFRRYFVHGGVVRLGDGQEVRRRLRGDVPEDQRAVVLVDLVGGYLSRGDFAE